MAKIKDPAKVAAKQQKKTHRPGIILFEIAWYTICIVVMVWGLTYIVLGLIADYTNIAGLITFSDTIKSSFGLSAFYWGILILAIGAIAMSIALLCVARVVDRDEEKKSRREARLAHLRELEEEERLASEEAPVVDAEVEPVSEEPVPEPVPEPVDEPVEEVPPEEPVEETPVEEPVEEAPVEEAPPEEPVVEETTVVEEAPVEETPVVEEPAPEPVQEPVEEAPVETTEEPAPETPVVETPSEEEK